MPTKTDSPKPDSPDFCFTIDGGKLKPTSKTKKARKPIAVPKSSAITKIQSEPDQEIIIINPNLDSTDPNQFGFAKQIEDHCKIILNAKLPDHKKLTGDKLIEFYGEAYQNLCKLDLGFGLLEMTYSRFVRMKGTILLRLYHIKPKLRHKSLLTEKQWTEFREKYCAESDDTIENWRNITHKFPLDNTEADSKGVAHMMACVRGERYLNSKNKRVPTIKVKDRDESTGTTGYEYTGAKREGTLKVCKIHSKIKDICSDIKVLIREIPKAEDLLEKTGISKSIIKEAEDLLKEKPFSGVEKELKLALKKARKIIATHEKGQKTDVHYFDEGKDENAKTNRDER